jgi:glycosyltransferase involved in cell wall biosynthesis
MVKVLYVVSTLARVGPTNQLFGIVSNLNRDEFDATILTLSPEGKDSLTPLFERNGIKINSLCLGRFKGIFIAKSKVKKFIKNGHFQIVHTSGIRADSILRTLHRDHFHHISTLRNFPREDYLLEFGRLKGFFFTKYHERLIKKMRYPIACSYSLKQKLKSLNPSVRIVQNGVDIDHFQLAESKNQAKEKLGFTQDKKILLCCGSLINRKKPYETALAFEKIRSDNWMLVFLGDGPLREKIESIRSKNIFLEGNVDNPLDYYQAADIFVSASVSEGLPNSVLEAMGCGNYCVLSDIDPHYEIIGESKVIGRLFASENWQDLAIVLRDSMLNVENIKPLEIRRFLEKNFSAHTTSQNYQKLYKEIAH